jgi:hypothetical protein
VERILSELIKSERKRRFVVGPPVPAPLEKKVKKKTAFFAHLLLPA